MSRETILWQQVAQSRHIEGAYNNVPGAFRDVNDAHRTRIYGSAGRAVSSPALGLPKDLPPISVTMRVSEGKIVQIATKKVIHVSAILPSAIAAYMTTRNIKEKMPLTNMTRPATP